jgi:hypothetical protein
VLWPFSSPNKPGRKIASTNGIKSTILGSQSPGDDAPKWQSDGFVSTTRFILLTINPANRAGISELSSEQSPLPAVLELALAFSETYRRLCRSSEGPPRGPALFTYWKVSITRVLVLSAPEVPGDCDRVNSQSQCAQFAPNVRNRNVLRVSRIRGLPFKDAAPLW